MIKLENVTGFGKITEITFKVKGNVAVERFPCSVSFITHWINMLGHGDFSTDHLGRDIIFLTLSKVR